MKPLSGQRVLDGEREFDSHLTMEPGQDGRRILRSAGLHDDDIARLAAQGAIRI